MGALLKVKAVVNSPDMHDYTVMFNRLNLSPGKVVPSSLQPLIEPWICASGTHYGWEHEVSNTSTYDQLGIKPQTC